MSAGDNSDSTAVDVAIVEWFDSIKGGKSPDREEFLRRYPEIKSELRRFFANYDSFRGRASVANVERASDTPPEMQPTVLATGSNVDSVTTSVRYRELELFKKGGLGTVYRAYDESLHRETAVKFVGDRCATDPALLSQFRIEAEITGRLDHPGVVPVYGIGEDWNGRPFYVMRLVKGRELTLAIQDYHAARVANPRGAETRRQLLGLLEHLVSACKTVAYAHDVGIIHCDIKPANVMVGRYGETFVLDWGLAVTFERTSTFMANEPTVRPRSSGDSSTSGQRGGTYGYISPEQLNPDEPIAPTSDIYSLGATLYEVLTGVPPFSGRDRNVSEWIRTGQFALPRTVVSTIPRRLEAICLKSMSLSPKGRYPTAKHLAGDLNNWMHDDELLAAPDRWWNRLGRKARRHRAVTATSALIVLVFAATAVWTTYQTEKHRYVNRQSELVQKSLNTSLDTFEDLCRPLANGEMKNLSTFRGFAIKINDFATEYLDQFERNPMMLTHTGRVYELRATVSRVLLADTSTALKYYLLAEENYKVQLRASTDQKEAANLQFRLAHVQLNLGQLYIQRSEYGEAESVLESGRAAIKSLWKQHGDAEVGRDLAEVYHALGEVNLYREVDAAAFSDALRQAEDYFVMSSDLRTELLQRAKGEELSSLQRDLARSHGYLGDLYLARGRVDKAEKSYTLSKDLREELYNANTSDPECRFQHARGLGNFGALERNYTGNLDQAVKWYSQARNLQLELAKQFDVKAFRVDLANTQNSLAEVYLWLAIKHQGDLGSKSEYISLSRNAAEAARKAEAVRWHAGDQLALHGLAWSQVTLAALDKLEEGKNTWKLTEEAKDYLSKLRDSAFGLGRSELVIFALALSLQGDAEGAWKAFSEAVDRGENAAVRFTMHGEAGLRTLANDPKYGIQFREKCEQARDRIKHR